MTVPYRPFWPDAPPGPTFQPSSRLAGLKASDRTFYFSFRAFFSFRASCLAAHSLSQLAGLDDPVCVCPPRDRELHHSVPKTIQQAFTEARICFRAKAFNAAAMMCRRTLEGICFVHGVESGLLKVKLKTLKEKEIIKSRLFEWAEELRTLGNEAAHAVELVVSREKR